MLRKITLLIFGLLFVSAFVSAATLEGTIYNSDLEIEENVLVEINTAPVQKMLAIDGEYSFSVTEGRYTLTAQKDGIVIKEVVEVLQEGTFVFDLFLLPDFIDEDELWQDSEEQFFTEDEEKLERNKFWTYLLTALVVLFGLYRIIKMRKRYGTLSKFRKHWKVEKRKSVEDHRKELEQEPGYLDEVAEIIKKHDGRISQKELRREMLHLSEAKISLIVTELEHKGRVEKVKKGRGNVILLKE